MSAATDFVRLAAGESVVAEAEVRHDRDPLYVFRVALLPLTIIFNLAKIPLLIAGSMIGLGALFRPSFGLEPPQRGYLVLTDRRMIYYVRERGILRDVHSLQDIRLEQIAAINVGGSDGLLSRSRWFEVLGEDNPAVTVWLEDRIIRREVGRDFRWVEKHLSTALAQLTDIEGETDG